MKKEIFQEIEIPEGIEVVIDKNLLKVKGPEGENEKKFNLDKINLEKNDSKIIVGTKVATKKEKKMINTIASHAKNMIEGVEKKFEYKLKICFTHFPINVEVKEDQLLIKNFLGEKISRHSKIIKDTDVSIDKDIITVISHNKESAGQTAANIETATKVRGKDLRIFQDGIFITNKPGRKI